MEIDWVNFRMNIIILNLKSIYSRSTLLDSDVTYVLDHKIGSFCIFYKQQKDKHLMLWKMALSINSPTLLDREYEYAYVYIDSILSVLPTLPYI